MQESVIKAEDLSIGYKVGGKTINVLYSSLNFELKSGELTTLMGVNGSGKSTLIKTLCRIIKPISGRISICGKYIQDYTSSELSKVLSIVLTERVADGGLTAYDVVSLGRYSYTGFFGGLSAKDKQIVEQSLNDVGIYHLKDRAVSTFSDGERQKVMIAKSLCQQTDIVILDEPTAFLDISSRIEIMLLLRELAHKQKRAFLVSSHDLELSLQYSDSMWIMAKDKGLFCGQTEDVVLSGDITKIIGDNPNFDFDLNTGVFSSNKSQIGVDVELCGKEVFWVKNALRREGYNICESAELKIIVNDYNNIVITKNGVTSTANSISEMIKKI